MKKIITGVKPTGSSMHLGNLMGAVLPFQRLAEGNDATIFIPDLHALTSVKDGKKLREQTLEVAIEYLAIFGTDSGVRIFRQSDIHDITRLMWILTNVTPYSLMLRAHSFKNFDQERNKLQNLLMHMRGKIETLEGALPLLSSDQQTIHKQELEKQRVFVEEYNVKLEEMIQDQNDNLNMGVFNYPILMAADIIGYDIDAVPVGRDQLQHLEMTRDIARNFNKTYGKEVFKEPEAIITKEVETLPGIDGRKMSKSYDNFIGIFDDEKTLKKRVMSIVTDSLGVDDVKNPDTCNVFALAKVFATADELALMRDKYTTPNIGFGYGHAKTMLLDILTRYLAPYRTRREKLLGDIPFVEAKLAEGAVEMNRRLEEKMKVVREVVGVN